MTDATAQPGRRVEVAPERLAGWLDRFARRHGEPDVARCPGGLVLSAADGASARLLPPWPLPEESPDGVDTVHGLVVHACAPRRVGLLLVRRGGFAAGVAEGPALVDSSVGRRHVQGKTKAGGWSQQRYARRRTAQAERAFAAAADTAARVLGARRDLQGLVAGGDRAAVSAVLEDTRLRRLRALPRSPFLATPDPRRSVLEEAVRRSRAVAVDVYDPEYDDPEHVGRS